MIPFLSPFILRLLGGRFKWLADLIAIAVILAFVAAPVGLWLHFHDRSVIADHEAAIKTEIINATSEASADANAATAKAETKFNTGQEKSRKDIQDAKDDNRSSLDALFK